MFAALAATFKEATSREDADARERNQRDFVMWAAFAHARKINDMETYGEVLECQREIEADSMFAPIADRMEANALAKSVLKELRAKNLVWCIFIEPYMHAARGMVCELAESEFAFLEKGGFVRRATETEAWERMAMDEDVKVPGKSLTRSRQIRNTCRALRPSANK